MRVYRFIAGVLALWAAAGFARGGELRIVSFEEPLARFLGAARGRSLDEQERLFARLVEAKDQELFDSVVWSKRCGWSECSSGPSIAKGQQPLESVLWSLSVNVPG